MSDTFRSFLGRLSASAASGQSAEEKIENFDDREQRAAHEETEEAAEVGDDWKEIEFKFLWTTTNQLDRFEARERL